MFQICILISLFTKCYVGQLIADLHAALANNIAATPSVFNRIKKHHFIFVCANLLISTFYDLYIEFMNVAKDIIL
jgi:hypothetical protein